MDFARLEHDIRRVPGVVACQLTPSEAIVLVGPDADPAEVRRRVELLLASAASAPALRVLGGRSPVVPFRRRHRGLVSLTAGAAALAAAGVAAAVSGVVAPSGTTRPSIGTAETAGPPATVPHRHADARVPALRVERDDVAAVPVATAPATSETQPTAQLATLGSPTLLVLPIPAPDTASTPAPHGVRHHAPAPHADAHTPPATPPAAGDLAPVSGETVAAAPPPPPPTLTTFSLTAEGDEHDHDRGETATDSNGHDENGPQGNAYGQGSGGDGGRRGH